MRLAPVWLALPIVLSSQALAQIAPPPGAAPPPTPEWSPPPPAKAVPAQSLPHNKEVERRWAAQTALPPLAYESLVKRDAQGKVILLNEPAQLVALRNNPSIDDETRQRLVAVLAHRQAKIDRQAIENLDLLEKVEAGALDNLEAPDTKTFIKQTGLLTKPLRPADNELNVELRTSGQITFDQSRWSQKLWQEYTKAVSDEIRQQQASAGGPNPMRVQKFTERQRIEETLFAYPRMLIEASRSLDKTLPQMGLSADTMKKIEPAMKTLAGSVPDAKREELMREMVKNFTLEQRQDLLRRTIALRPPLPAVQAPPVRPVTPAPGAPQPVPAPAPAPEDQAPAEAPKR